MNSTVEISVLIPARDEAGSLPFLIPEVCAELAGESFEVIVIDDASEDETASVVDSLTTTCPELRLIRNLTAAGKSGALWAGAASARGEFGLTLDGDCQNDPRYLKPMIQMLREKKDVALIVGQRQIRGDGRLKHIASRIANGTRSRLLKDGTRDTACGLKAFRLEAFRSLPFFETLHRFLPALFTADGWKIDHLDVIDRPRKHGVSKYGIIDRLAIGLPDLFGVWWLTRRRIRQAKVQTVEVVPPIEEDPPG